MVAGVSAGEGMECVEGVVVVEVVEVVGVVGVVATGGVFPVRSPLVPALIIRLIKN
ncbi:hypothetical protein PR003_g13163 [Phytophthora rubi]|uniref:Uncharacterized protein n=1 Tax=Phytophthora rubi TaxID=129364 RepID=A0A6A4FG32_9STRA|nr:hypothetical protein PR002_g12474 [Phytophthora rubi]KAE9335139.1 hypothetical protein PR003_g13163 [Phytophthora rubi]